MPKIETFDGAGFWKNAYAHQRGKLLKKVNVPEDQIIVLVNKNIVASISPNSTSIQYTNSHTSLYYH